MGGYASQKKAEAMQVADEESDDEEISQADILQAVTDLAKKSRSRSSKKIQQSPKATGEKYADFECFIVRPTVITVPIPNTDKLRTVISKIDVMERVRQVKIEPHLVYGSPKLNTVGFNDQILLGSDGAAGGLVQLYFPVKFDENGKKIETYGAKQGDRFNATTLEIFVNAENGKYNKRSFNLYEYNGSKKLKEMVADVKAEWEYKFPEVFE